MDCNEHVSRTDTLCKTHHDAYPVDDNASCNFSSPRSPTRFESQPSPSMALDNDDNILMYDDNDGVHEHVERGNDNIVKPSIGMMFDSEADALEFYNLYAKRVGFSTRKDTVHRSSKTKSVIARMIVCSKEGYKDLNDKRELGREIKRRREERQGCEAHMFVKDNGNGSWVIKQFHEEHNHTLASPSKVTRLRSHKKVSTCTRTLIDTLHTCGLPASKISSVLGASREENVTGQVCRDQIKRTRKNNIGNECMSIIRCFEEKMNVDPDFFFKVEIDEDRMVRSVFWADGRSRNSYMSFGDVVVFDTTYRTNKFSMPFAPFTGINHHRQSTLFGCALLADETTETFVWLFNNWLTCMHGKMPIGIITDQDPAMKEAIARVFPSKKT